MKISITILSLLIFYTCYSQVDLFESINVDSTTKIIGRYDYHDKEKTYEHWNFILEDSVNIVKFIDGLRVGKEVANFFEQPHFRISLIHNNEETGTWIVNPSNKSIMTYGHSYSFNLKQIKSLNKKFGFKYYVEKKSFESRTEFESYKDKESRKPNYLFSYSPNFKYEGSFEIEFKKSETFASPKFVSQYLRPYLEEIVDPSLFNISYVLNEKNKKDNSQFTMKISGPKKLYNQLNIDGLKNENWQIIIATGTFYYKEK